MRQLLRPFVAVPFLLAACGKREAAPPPALTPPPTAAAAPTAPPSPAPEAVQAAAAQPDPKQGNWWAMKAQGEKQEIMEGWLNQYSSGNAAAKAAVTKEIQNAKLSAADKAMLESLRQRLKLAPIPLQ